MGKGGSSGAEMKPSAGCFELLTTTQLLRLIQLTPSDIREAAIAELRRRGVQVVES